MEENTRESSSYYERNKEKVKAAALKRYYDKKDQALNYSKEYYLANKDKKKKASAKRYNDNKEELKEYGRIYQKENYDLTKGEKSIYHKKYRAKNKSKLTKYAKDYVKKRRKEDLIFKLRDNFRSLISTAIRKKGYIKNKKTEIILGCSFEEFKVYLESKFELWMTWDNYGIYNSEGPRTWNIDHIIPVASANTKEDIIRLNHHSNLRPLCSKENLDKRDKLL